MKTIVSTIYWPTYASTYFDYYSFCRHPHPLRSYFHLMFVLEVKYTLPVSSSKQVGLYNILTSFLDLGGIVNEPSGS